MATNTYRVVFENEIGEAYVVVEAQDEKEAKHKVMEAQGCSAADIKSIAKLPA